MNTDYLQDFLVLAEIGNYEEAAFRLYTTQSTLTKHIQNLEEELGSPLFTRSNGRTSLSSFGETFMPYARKYFSLMEDFRHEQNGESRTVSDSFVISYNKYMEAYGIFDVLKDFHRTCPKYTAIVNNDSPGKSLDLGTTDLSMLFVRDPADSNFDRRYVTTDQLSIVVSKKNNLSAGIGAISVQRLQGNSFITCHNTSYITQLTRAFFRQYGINANVPVSMPSVKSAIRLVGLSDNYVLLLPSVIASYYISDDVVVKNTVEDFSFNVSLMSLKGKKLPAAAQAFVDMAIKKLGEIHYGNIIS